MTEPLLAVRGVKSFYGNIMALKGVAVDVHEGEIVTLIGANGAGKSTLMMTIFGNPRAREGRIVYPGARHHGSAHPRDRRLRIAQSPEGRRIFPRMTVRENLQMARKSTRARISRRIWPRSAPSSRCWPAASTSAAARSRAASSRCWRSPAHS
jgi:ABC-type branched-subunit amino acid transport system ATPase component